MKFIQDIIRELKQELHKTERKAAALPLTDDAKLYYNGVIIGLKLSIGKYEQWLYDTKPKKINKKRRNKNESNHN